MTETGPSGDGYKMPIVTMSIGSADVLRDINFLEQMENRGNHPFLFVPRYARKVLTANGITRINAWEHLQSFEFSIGQNKSLQATFKLFDPEFDRLLSYFLEARSRAGLMKVFYRFGWIVDGGNSVMSPVHSGVVVAPVEPEFVMDGCHLTINVTQQGTFARSVERPQPRTWPSGTPAHIIVSQALSGAWPRESPLTSGITPPRVRTPVPCLPALNNGQDFIMRDTAPIPWLREHVIPQALAADENLRHLPFALFDDDRNPGGLVFAPQGWNGRDESLPKRTYHVGRGRMGMVRKFAPKDNSAVAELLGGGGRTGGVDSRTKQPVDVEKRNLPLPDNNDSDGPPESYRFHRHTFNRDMETMRQYRQAQWAAANSAVIYADAEIIGDPHIRLNDKLRFLVYRGGTLSTAGKPIDSADPIRPDSVTPIEYLSGLYVVLGYTHRIEHGNFTTEMDLAISDVNKRSPRNSKDHRSDLDNTNSISGSPNEPPTPETVTKPKPLVPFNQL